MKMGKSSIAVFLLVCATTVSTFAKDNPYVAACKSDENIRDQLATLHGPAQVGKYIGAFCGCKYNSLLKGGISAIDIQKLMDGKYGMADPQMPKILAAEMRAGVQCMMNDGKEKPADKQAGMAIQFAETKEDLVIKGIMLGMSKWQLQEMFPQIHSDSVAEIAKDTPDSIYGDTFIHIVDEYKLSCHVTDSTRTCNKISFAGFVPDEVTFIFIEDKLVLFNAKKNRSDNLYKEIKSAFSEKFKVQPSEVTKGSATESGWRNVARNEKIYLGGDGSSVLIKLLTNDFDAVTLQRKKALEETKAKVEAEAEQDKAKAEAEKARKRAADL